MHGFEGQKIATQFQLEEARAILTLNEFEALLAALGKHLYFSGSSAPEHQNLKARVQRPGETVTNFLVAVRHQASFL